MRKISGKTEAKTVRKAIVFGLGFYVTDVS